MSAPRRLDREQLKDLLAYAQHIGDKQLGAVAARALDGDSLYNDAMQERCAAAYAGAHRSAEFAEAAATRRAAEKPLLWTSAFWVEAQHIATEYGFEIVPGNHKDHCRLRALRRGGGASKAKRKACLAVLHDRWGRKWIS